MTPIETFFASLTTNDALLLISAGALVAAIAILNNLLRTIFRRGKVGFLDLLLTFGAVLLPVIGLTVANLNDVPDTFINDSVVWIAAALVFTHVIILLLELIRPPRWKSSRGLLGVFSGGLLVAATFGIPFVAAFTSINAGLRTDPPAVVETGADGEIVVPAEAESRIVEMFRMILSFIAEDIDMEPIAVAEAIDDGIPLATLISDRGGDVEGVIRRITIVTRDSIRASAAAGEINALQAALFVSQAEPLVRLIVNNDVNTLGQRFGGPTPDPDAARPRLAEIFEPTPTPDEALIAIAPTNTPTATVTPTITATPSPMLTATPSLTPTPSPTRFVFATRQPRGYTAAGSTIAPAVGGSAAPDGAVCFASVTNNLRLRTAQDYTSATLAVIPFTARIELYGRGRNIDAEASWWLARYEGAEGFVDGAFLLLDSNCQNLPYRGG